jgi:hypothetical protein
MTSRLRTLLSRSGLAGLLAICALAVSSPRVWAQMYCGGPGVICVYTPFGGGCEPAVTPAAKAMCPEEKAAPEPPPQAKPKAQPQAQPQAQPKAPAQPTFNSQAPFQIQPLKCPGGFVQTGTTFYGGTRCAPPAAQPRPAAAKPPPGTVRRANDNVLVQPTAPEQWHRLRWPDNESLQDVEAANNAAFLAHRREYVSLWMRAAAVAVGAVIGGAIAGQTGAVVAGALVLYREWKAMKGELW